MDASPTRTPRVASIAHRPWISSVSRKRVKPKTWTHRKINESVEHQACITVPARGLIDPALQRALRHAMIQLCGLGKVNLRISEQNGPTKRSFDSETCMWYRTDKCRNYITIKTKSSTSLKANDCSCMTASIKGYAHFPYEWSPSTVDIQMLRVGNFVMLIMPGELTTMSGRRIRYVYS